LKKLIIDLIDKFWKNFKVLILLFKTNSPPSRFLSARSNIPLRDTNKDFQTRQLNNKEDNNKAPRNPLPLQLSPGGTSLTARRLVS